MILRKRNKNKKLMIEKVNMKEGDTLIVKYPTFEDGTPMYSYEHLVNMRDGLKERFGDIIIVSDKVSFGKIHKELNNIPVDEIIKIKDEIFEENGYIDKWVQAECWTKLLKKFKIDLD